MSDKTDIFSGKKKLIVCAVLALVTLAVYWQVNRFDFVNFDDVVYVIDNSHIKSGITPDEIRWAFGTRHFDLWHPLVWISFMFDYQFHGLNPAGYHLTNLILHILSTLLLFWLFCRMTGALWKSAFVAALFALHPLHVESVAWIAERKDVLSAFFWMLTLCFYVYYTEKPVIKRYLPVMFAFVLALLSKPMVVTLPLIMILLDYWPLNRFESKKDNLILWQLKEKLPFIILSAVLVIITLHTPATNAAAAEKSFPLISRLANAPLALIAYLGKTFWPYDLAVFYPFPDKLPLWQVLGALSLIVIMTVFVIAMKKRLPYLFAGWLWYVITILPVLGIIHIGYFATADRYHYLPSTGIAVMLAWGIPSFIKREDIRRKILFPAGIIFIAVLSFLSWKQCSVWKNSYTLFSHALRVTNNNYLAHANLASFMFERGKIREAVYHYSKAISIVPDYDVAYYNLGIVYYHLGQKQQAIENFKEAIRITPNYAAAYYNMGIVYLDLGQYQNAVANYSQAIRISPGYAYAYNDRALAYLKQGNNASGCLDAQKACALGICKVMEWAKNKGQCR